MKENRFTILMYHIISVPRSNQEIRYACSPNTFEKHIRKLRESKFNFVSFDEINDHFTKKTSLPKKSILITIDDGFEDNYLHAYPILMRYNIPATIFLATGYIGGFNAWMTKNEFPKRRLLSWDQIKEMHLNGITFGAHTVNHPRLPEIKNDIALQEIKTSKSAVEENLGIECKYFAYPYGLFSELNTKQVECAGFRLACSTRPGFNTVERNPYVLHRIEVYGTDTWWRLNQKITFGMNDSSIFHPIKYYTDRILDRLIS